jgi:hypothetical protein
VGGALANIQTAKDPQAARDAMLAEVLYHLILQAELGRQAQEMMNNFKAPGILGMFSGK